MSEYPLNVEDVVSLRYRGRSIAAGKTGPIPDLRVFRTEWIYEPDESKPGGWSQSVLASAPGVGSVRFTWGPAGGYARAFGKAWDVTVKARARRLAPTGWNHMDDAPMNATWVTVLMPDGREIEAHWACDLSGEVQPPFRGWFTRYESGSGFYGIGTPVAWKPVADRPQR